MTTQPESAGGRPRAAGRSSARSAKLSREVIVNAALTFLDREGWDALTINALAIQLGTKGPSLYNHVDSLEDLRRTVRMRVIDDILQMLSTVGAGPHPRRRGDGHGQRLPQLRPPPSRAATRRSPGCRWAATTPSSPPPRTPPPHR